VYRSSQLKHLKPTEIAKTDSKKFPFVFGHEVSSAWTATPPHWKERARIDAAPGPERKAFVFVEWLREQRGRTYWLLPHTLPLSLAADWVGFDFVVRQ
tara:strand:+ start:898 stop:1191 length:294 start_codon:yes stop_codon:yes gene_type:complete